MNRTTTDTNPSFKPLTRHPIGSFRELTSIALPLLLAGISGGLMYFLDRLILANYSVSAMNAAVAAGMVGFVLHFSFMGIATISEVLVGRNNGAQEDHKIGPSTWQMIWFALMTLLVYLPVGVWGGSWLIPEDYYLEGIGYYHWMMFGGVCFPLVGALTGFYVGRGKTTLVVWLNIISNVINLVLDVILVFGWDPYIPAMGATGAAIGTIAAMAFLAIGLLIGFFMPTSQQRYHTLKARFLPPVFKEALRIGLPNALSHGCELLAHLVVIHIVAAASPAHMTVFALGQSFFVLFAMLTDALSQGGRSVMANLIGGKKLAFIPKSFFAMLKLHALFSVIAAIAFIGFPEPLAQLFLSGGIGHNASDIDPLVMEYALGAFFWFWAFFVIDGLMWSLWSIFTAAGDTVVVMFINAFNIWFFEVLLIYVIVHIYGGSAYWVWPVILLYALANTICYAIRFYLGSWKKAIRDV